MGSERKEHFERFVTKFDSMLEFIKLIQGMNISFVEKKIKS